MSTSLTIEEALALMINMDFIPDGETVLTMTEAFLEVATVEYVNAYSSDKYQMVVLKNRMEICEARHNLALLLEKSLFEDAIYTENTLIECADNSTDENPLVTLDSLTDWAYDRFGIGISSKTNLVQEKPNATPNTKSPSWEDVTIKIYADNNLGYSIGDGTFKRASFMDIGLIGKRKLVPNDLGGILIGLSTTRKYPTNGIVESKHKTAISKLKRSLIQLTGLSGEPFYKPNKADGYKPRFVLIDDRRNADERAKKEATHESYDPERDLHTVYAEPDDFDSNGDAAGNWIKAKGG